MPAQTSALPPDFSDLEEFIDWARPLETGRVAKRMASTFEEIKRFYDAMLARAEAALAYLDEFPLDDMPEPERRLLDMLLSLAEVTMAVEVYHTVWQADVIRPERMPPTAEADAL